MPSTNYLKNLKFWTPNSNSITPAIIFQFLFLNRTCCLSMCSPFFSHCDHQCYNRCSGHVLRLIQIKSKKSGGKINNAQKRTLKMENSKEINNGWNERTICIGDRSKEKLVKGSITSWFGHCHLLKLYRNFRRVLIYVHTSHFLMCFLAFVKKFFIGYGILLPSQCNFGSHFDILLYWIMCHITCQQTWLHPLTMNINSTT